MPIQNSLLGVFVVDRANERLVHNGIAVALRPKTWQVLLHLVERPGVLVTGAELFDRIWPGQATTPQALTNVIHELRRALAADPSVRIETQHRRGYRLVTTEPAVAAPTPTATPLRRAQIFVGREHEQSQLVQLWEKACRGQRQFALIEGFAGVGKTTLVGAFVDRLSQEGARLAQCQTSPLILRGVCLDCEWDPEPYGPIADALESALAESDLLPALRAYAPSWLARIPWLLPPDEMAALRASLAGTGTARVLREAARLFEAISAENPTLVVLEDIHLADAPTLDLLNTLASRAGHAQLMVVATYRPRPANTPLRQLVGRLVSSSKAIHLYLEAFTSSQVRAYVEERFGDVDLARQLGPALEAKSGGNALMLEEMLSALLGRRWLAPTDDGWRLTVSANDLAHLFPERTRELIQQHLRELAPEAIAVLEAASVVGEEFTDKSLAVAVDLSPETVSSTCRGLADAGPFIALVGEEILPDGLPWDRYRFRHDLYRRAFAEGLSAVQRRLYHVRIAEGLAHDYRATPALMAPRLAMHFGAAGHFDRQLFYLDIAAGDAVERSAYAEAAGFLCQAIEVGERIYAASLTTSPNAGRTATALRLCERRLAYGNLLTVLSGICDPRVHHAYARNLEFSEIHQAPDLYFRSQLGLCMTSAMSSSAEARTFAAELVRVAEVGRPELLAVAYIYSALAEARLGAYSVARPFAENACARLAIASKEFPWHLNLAAFSHATTNTIFIVCGDNSRAVNHRNASLAAIDATTSPYGRATLYGVLSYNCMLAHDPYEAYGLGERAIAVGEEFGIAVHPDAARCSLTWAQWKLGRGSLGSFEVAVRRREATTERWHQSIMHAYLAEGYLADGSPQLAAAELERIQPEPAFEAEIMRVRGEVAAARSEHEKAGEHFATAVRIAQEQGSLLFEQRAAARLEA